MSKAKLLSPYSGKTRRLLVLSGISLPVVSPEHLIAQKIFAMKNDPSRTFYELADIKLLLGLHGTDLESVRYYFRKYDLMERYYDLIGQKRESK